MTGPSTGDTTFDRANGRAAGDRPGWSVSEFLSRARAQLDAWGQPGWIAAMVAGFVLFWPLGLALLFYMLWSGRMSCRKRTQYRGWSGPRWGQAASGSGNTAFDAYRQETLARLEREQDEFESFMDRLRAARDKAEFDQFMAERRAAAASAGQGGGQSGQTGGSDQGFGQQGA